MAGHKRKSFMCSLVLWTLFQIGLLVTSYATGQLFLLLTSGAPQSGACCTLAPHGKLTAGKYQSTTRTTQVWRCLSTITAWNARPHEEDLTAASRVEQQRPVARRCFEADCSLLLTAIGAPRSCQLTGCGFNLHKQHSSCNTKRSGNPALCVFPPSFRQKLPLPQEALRALPGAQLLSC